MNLMSRFLSKIDALWRSRASGLAKYIVLYASLLHVFWAGLLISNAPSGDATPVHIVLLLCGGRYRAAFVLVAVAVCAIGYVFDEHGLSAKTMSLLLIPQQLVLFLSAGAGLRAAVIQQYADGVHRHWSFILSDQLPVILVALLYTLAIIEIAFTRDV